MSQEDILMQILNTVNDIKKTVDEHTKTLNQHTKLLEKHTHMLDEHSKRIRIIKKSLDRYDDNISKLNGSVLKMEQDFNSKIQILFDVREQAIDMAKSNESKIVNLENKHYRLEARVDEIALDLKKQAN